MFALSSSASNGHVRNRYGYQGQERENTFALNLNEFEARHYDPQAGRWMVPDPAQQFPSPYVGMGNQWVSGVDPDGRFVFMAAALVASKFILGTKLTLGAKMAIGAAASMVANHKQIKAATEGENGNAWRGIGTALGYAAVGAGGALATDKLGAFWGFTIGGSLNVGYEWGLGKFDPDKVNVPGRVAGSFLTGGFSALAAKNFGEGLEQGGSLARNALKKSEIKYKAFSSEKLKKFGMSGLENLGNKFNEYDGKLDFGQIMGIYSSGFIGAFASYSLNYLGMKYIPNASTRKGYGFAAVASPFVSNMVANFGQDYLNYVARNRKAPEKFSDFYKDYIKSIYKLDFYTASSLWGFRGTLDVWKFLSDPNNVLR